MVSVSEMAAQISAEIEARLHVRGPDLKTQLRRVGRRMPGYVRRDARAVAEAQAQADHPKLARQLDLPRLEVAERRVMAWLKTVDPKARRKELLFSIFGGAALSVMVVLFGLIAVALWQQQG
ncbi:hypothetical protein [Actibacterium sp.]|uniref:hypothetical protein n=1 Tax=Actibacterium sp. TaxID=1872125 RepID=UPI003566CBAF